MTRAEIEALARRIVLATIGREAIGPLDGPTCEAFEAAHPEAAEGRRRIAGRYRELSRAEYWPESEIRAKAEWVAGVLAEAFGGAEG
jgi:hypothetical protein